MDINRQDAADHDVELNMTPLIDIVFLLLAFFMVVSVFNQMERAAELKLPTVAQAAVKDKTENNRMIINLRQDGRVVLFGQTMDLAGLKKQLDQRKDLLKRLGRKATSASVIIRGDQDVPFKHVKKVLKALKQRGVEAMRFAAYKQRN